MRIFNLEFGLQDDAKGRVVWTWYETTECFSGCSCRSFGPFYFTILRGECK